MHSNGNICPSGPSGGTPRREGNPFRERSNVFFAEWMLFPRASRSPSMTILILSNRAPRQKKRPSLREGQLGGSGGRRRLRTELDVKTARQFGGGIAAGGSELGLRQALGGGEI